MLSVRRIKNNIKNWSSESGDFAEHMVKRYESMLASRNNNRRKNDKQFKKAN